MPLLVAAILAFTPGIRTPSGNISCFASHGVLVCSIRASAYGAALQRGCRQKAGLDWHGFELSVARRAEPVCSGGALYDSPPRYHVLAYGRAWRVGRISCTSRITRLTCTAGAHALSLSRQAWRR